MRLTASDNDIQLDSIFAREIFSRAMHSPAASFEAKAAAQLAATSKTGSPSGARASGPMAPVTSQGDKLAAEETIGAASGRLDDGSE